MATVTKRPPSSAAESPAAANAPLLVRACMAVYRFLASLTLALISLGTLAAVLAYATFFESWYGTAAVQEWIYRSPGFAVLLAFLGTNIFCAAAIRYPWKKRQIGFLITHAGLLVLLAGSWITLRQADEGRMVIGEGETSSQIIREDYPAIRVRQLDEKNEPTAEYALEFRPGAFDWKPGQPRPRGIFGSLFHALTLGLFDSGTSGELLTDRRTPFKLEVLGHYPAAAPVYLHEEQPGGEPMLRAHMVVKPPGQLHGTDILEMAIDPTGVNRWLVAERTPHGDGLDHVVHEAGAARFSFQAVDSEDDVEDFLHPPEKPGPEGTAILHYKDRAGHPRTYSWRLDSKSAGTKVSLPDSDLTVTLSRLVTLDGRPTDPDEDPRAAQLYNLLSRMTGEETIRIANFQVRAGDGPEHTVTAGAGLPKLDQFFQGLARNREKAPIRVTYFYPPIGSSMDRTPRATVEVLGTAAGKLYYRVYNAKGFQKAGPLALGKDTLVLGDGQSQRMSATLRVDEYLPSGRERLSYEALVLPKDKMGQGLPAALVRMTVKGETREFWVQRSESYDPAWKTVSFPDGSYEVAYDFDRRDLGFNVKLVDFDHGFDPGSDQPSSYTSKVRLTDPKEGIEDRPVTITMNEPMVNRQWTFYQSSFFPVFDPHTKEETGFFKSVFQVGSDPGRPVKYFGCAMIVLGAFVQFYMRAGIFTDGGKREREREAARKARKETRLASANGKVRRTEESTPPTPPEPESL